MAKTVLKDVAIVEIEKHATLRAGSVRMAAALVGTGHYVSKDVQRECTVMVVLRSAVNVQ